MDEKIIMDMLKMKKASIHADVNPRVKESRVVCEGRGIDLLSLSLLTCKKNNWTTAHVSRAILQAINAVNSTNWSWIG